MANAGEGKYSSISILIRYVTKCGKEDTATATCRSTKKREVLRLVRHNTGSRARDMVNDVDRITFREADAVPDVLRYWCQNNSLVPVADEGYFYSDKRRDQDRVPLGITVPDTLNMRPVLLLLESPHVDEVTCDLKGWLPAAGSAGRQIHDGAWILLYALSKVTSKNLLGAPLIIANPLPHPASLRCEPLYAPLRDAVFTSAMGMKGLRAGFRRRLSRYNPVVIINACTGQSETDEDEDEHGRINTLDSPKYLVRSLVNHHWSNKQVQRHVYSRHGEAGEVLGQISGSRRPTRYLIELPHPSGWGRVAPHRWFHINQSGSVTADPAFRAWMGQYFPSIAIDK